MLGVAIAGWSTKCSRTGAGRLRQIFTIYQNSVVLNSLFIAQCAMGIITGYGKEVSVWYLPRVPCATESSCLGIYHNNDWIFCSVQSTHQLLHQGSEESRRYGSSTKYKIGSPSRVLLPCGASCQCHVLGPSFYTARKIFGESGHTVHDVIPKVIEKKKHQQNYAPIYTILSPKELQGGVAI